MKPPFSDSTKARIASVLRERSLLPATTYIEEIYRIIREDFEGRFTEDLIRTVARQVGVPHNQQLWDQVFGSIDGGNDYNLAANRSLILAGSQLPVNFENLSTEFNRLLRDAPESLGLRPEAENRRRLARQRQARIDRITDGGKYTNFPVFSKSHGQCRWIPCSTLENEPDDVLELLAEGVPELRRQISGGRTEKQTITHSDSLGELSSKPESVTDTSSAAIQIINPTSGKEFTRDELLRLVKTDPAGFRKLIFPQGSPAYRKAVADKVNKLLAGSR